MLFFLSWSRGAICFFDSRENSQWFCAFLIHIYFHFLFHVFTFAMIFISKCLQIIRTHFTISGTWNIFVIYDLFICFTSFFFSAIFFCFWYNDRFRISHVCVELKSNIIFQFNAIMLTDIMNMVDLRQIYKHFQFFIATSLIYRIQKSERNNNLYDELK